MVGFLEAAHTSVDDMVVSRWTSGGGKEKIVEDIEQEIILEQSETRRVEQSLRTPVGSPSIVFNYCSEAKLPSFEEIRR